MGIIKKTQAWIQYILDLREMKKQLKDTNNPVKITQLYPIVMDRFASSGTGRGAYFHQDLWVARKIFENKPIKHLDIGSRIDGFVAHVASFREIEVIDIRPAPGFIRNIKFIQADFSSTEPMFENYCDSISSLHALEHFGLGRYGDPIDANGYLRGLENIKCALQVGGKFYFSVPIGKLRIEFNAHRIFSIDYLLHLLEPNYVIDSFAYIDDYGNLHDSENLNSLEARDNFNCREGCGVFELTKK